MNTFTYAEWNREKKGFSRKFNYECTNEGKPCGVAVNCFSDWHWSGKRLNWNVIYNFEDNKHLFFNQKRFRICLLKNVGKLKTYDKVRKNILSFEKKYSEYICYKSWKRNNEKLKVNFQCMKKRWFLNQNETTTFFWLDSVADLIMSQSIKRFKTLI